MDKEKLERIVREAVENQASDVHLTVGLPPYVRVDGELIPLPYPVLSAQDCWQLAKELLAETAWEAFLQAGEYDGAYSVPGLSRFRLNVFRQRGTVSLALRVIPFHIPSFDELGLPDVTRNFIKRTHGLFLVTGPTGSGKSTTLAAMVDEINRTMAKHVITLEDPIEYLHSHRKSIVVQREIGLDTASFAAGLHAALREDPDIIGVALLGRVRQKDFVPFCRQFAALVRSGVPLVQTLALLAEQTGNKRLRQALLQVSALVQEGESLQDAFGQQRLFPEMFVRLLGVGEFSGQLPVVLERLADFYEKEQRLRQKVVSVFVYPATVLLAAVVVSLYLLVSVVPTFVQAFEQQGIPLPLPTRITVAVSQFLLDFWYLLLLLTVLLGVMGAYLRRTPQGKQWFGRLRLAVPIFGALEKKNILARFARTLALLVSSAVPILEALRLVGKSLGNDLYRRSLDEAVQGLSEGERIYATLERKRKLFPLMVTQMIAIGEEAGKLDFMLDKLADFYEQEVQTMTSRLHALMEPVLIMILAVVVGGIIVSVYMPMFIMMDAIGQ